jgi:XTP/dITP diphosphohydrolase
VIVLASQGELLGSFGGVINGKVILEERGESGFGYDSMFIPQGYMETFGELQSEIKNSLSHRGRALAKVLEFLRS